MYEVLLDFRRILWNKLNKKNVTILPFYVLSGNLFSKLSILEELPTNHIKEPRKGNISRVPTFISIISPKNWLVEHTYSTPVNSPVASRTGNKNRAESSRVFTLSKWLRGARAASRALETLVHSRSQRVNPACDYAATAASCGTVLKRAEN